MNAHTYFVNRIRELLIERGLAVWISRPPEGTVPSRARPFPVLVLAASGKAVSLVSPGDLLDLLWEEV